MVTMKPERLFLDLLKKKMDSAALSAWGDWRMLGDASGELQAADVYGRLRQAR